jgi:hypothetical protein
LGLKDLVIVVEEAEIHEEINNEIPVNREFYIGI